MAAHPATKRNSKARLDMWELIILLTKVTRGFDNVDLPTAKSIFYDLYYVILGFQDRDESNNPNPYPNFAIFEIQLMEKATELRLRMVTLIAQTSGTNYYENASLDELMEDFNLAHDCIHGFGTDVSDTSAQSRNLMAELLFSKITGILKNNLDYDACQKLWQIHGKFPSSHKMYKKALEIGKKYDPHREHTPAHVRYK